MPASKQSQVIHPLPSLFVEDSGKHIAASEREASPHRTNTKLRALAVWELSFGLWRGLHPQFVQQFWRNSGCPLGRQIAIIDLNTSIVTDSEAAHRRRCDPESIFGNVAGMEILIIRAYANRMTRVELPVAADQAGVLIGVAGECACE